MKKKKILLTVLWLAVLAVAGMIFYFSSQDGPDSANTSSVVVNWLLDLTQPDYRSLPRAQRTALFRQYQLYVRKTAHFSEFALLGVFLKLLLRALKTRFQFGIAWLAGTLYAVTDEWHQYLIGTRTSAWTDVFIDSAGVFFGVSAVTLLLFLQARKKEKRGNPA